MYQIKCITHFNLLPKMISVKKYTLPKFLCSLLTFFERLFLLGFVTFYKTTPRGMISHKDQLKRKLIFAKINTIKANYLHSSCFFLFRFIVQLQNWNYFLFNFFFQDFIPFGVFMYSIKRRSFRRKCRNWIWAAAIFFKIFT